MPKKTCSKEGIRVPFRHTPCTLPIILENVSTFSLSLSFSLLSFLYFSPFAFFRVSFRSNLFFFHRLKDKRSLISAKRAFSIRWTRERKGIALTGRCEKKNHFVQFLQFFLSRTLMLLYSNEVCFEFFILDIDAFFRDLKYNQ